MKRRLLPWLVALLLLPACALAGVEFSPDHPMLRRSSLRAPILQTEYADYALYQPFGNPSGDDAAYNSDFDRYPFFPVVAVKDDRAVLILLRRENPGEAKDRWAIHAINEDALFHPSFTLINFSMDTLYSVSSQVSFTYIQDEGYPLSLYMRIENVGDPRFFSMSYRPEPPIEPPHDLQSSKEVSPP